MTESFETPPAEDDIRRFAAVGTPLEYCFRKDGYPLEYPLLSEGEFLVFDYDYDDPETGVLKRGFKLVENQREMAILLTAVRHNFVGVIGWRVVAYEDLTD
jgi:hypothetical protein